MRKKKITAVLLSLVFLLTSVLPSAAFAENNSVTTEGGATPAIYQEGDGMVKRWQDSLKLRGYPDGSLGLDRELTRAEFAAFLMRLTKSEEKADLSAFTDINADDWFYQSIAKAVAQGYIVGKSETLMAPRDKITSEEVSAIAMRLLDQLEKKEKGQTSSKADEKIIEKAIDPASDWAKKEIARSILEGLIGVKKDGSLEFKPQKNITRMDMIRILDRTLENRRIITVPGVYELGKVKHLQIASGGVTVKNTTVEETFFVPKGVADDDNPIVLEKVEINGKKVVQDGNAIQEKDKPKDGTKEESKDGYQYYKPDNSSSRRSSSADDNTVVADPVVEGITVSADKTSVHPGDELEFKATVSGKNLSQKDKAVTWKLKDGLNYAAGTKIDQSGKLTIAEDEAEDSITVIATSSLNPQMSAEKTVKVVPKPVLNPVVKRVSVKAKADKAYAGDTIQFSAVVEGDNLKAEDKKVIWTLKDGVNYAAGTSVDDKGKLTIAEDEANDSIVVVATSVFNPNISAEKTIQILKPVVKSVSVTAKVDKAHPGDTVQFSAVVAGDNLQAKDKKVIWKLKDGVNYAAGTSVDDKGKLTIGANEANDSITVQAISETTPDVSGEKTIQVRAKLAADVQAALDKLQKLIDDNKGLLESDANALTKGALEEALNEAQAAADQKDPTVQDLDAAHKKLDAFLKDFKQRGPMSYFPSLANLKLKDGVYIGLGGGFYPVNTRPMKSRITIENGQIVAAELEHFGDDGGLFKNAAMIGINKINGDLAAKDPGTQNEWITKLHRAFEYLRETVEGSKPYQEPKAYVPGIDSDKAAMESIGWTEADARTGATYSVSGYTRALVDGMNQAYLAAKDMESDVVAVLFKEGDEYKATIETRFLTVGDTFDPAILTIGLKKKDGTIEDVPFAQWKEKGISTTLEKPYEAKEANQSLKVTIKHDLSQREATYNIYTKAKEKSYASPVSIEYAIGDSDQWVALEGLKKIKDSYVPEGYNPESLAFSQKATLPAEAKDKKVKLRFLDAEGKAMPYKPAEIQFNEEKDYKFVIDDAAFQTQYGDNFRYQYETFYVKLSVDSTVTPTPDAIHVDSIEITPYYENKLLSSDTETQEIDKDLSQVSEAVTFALSPSYKTGAGYFDEYQAILKYTENGESKEVKNKILKDDLLNEQEFTVGKDIVKVNFIYALPTFDKIRYTIVDTFNAEPSNDAVWTEISLPSAEEMKENNGFSNVEIPIDASNVGKYLKIESEISYPKFYKLSPSTVNEMSIDRVMKLKDEENMSYFYYGTSDKENNAGYSYGLKFVRQAAPQPTDEKLKYPDYTPIDVSGIKPGVYEGTTDKGYQSIPTTVRLEVKADKSFHFSTKVWGDDDGPFKTDAEKLYGKLNGPDFKDANHVLRLGQEALHWKTNLNRLVNLPTEEEMRVEARRILDVEVPDNTTRNTMDGPLKAHYRKMATAENKLPVVFDTCSNATYSGIGIAIASANAMQVALDSSADDVRVVKVEYVADSLNKTSFTPTDNLDLTGLKVKLTRNDHSTEIISYEDFAANDLVIVNKNPGDSEAVIENPESFSLAPYENQAGFYFGIKHQTSGRESNKILVAVAKPKAELGVLTMELQAEGDDQVYTSNDLDALNGQLILPEALKGKTITVRVRTESSEWPTLPMALEYNGETGVLSVDAGNKAYENTFVAADKANLGFVYRYEEYPALKNEFGFDHNKVKPSKYFRNIRDFVLSFGDTNLTVQP